MSLQEKQAWFNLVVIVAAITTFLVLVPVMGPQRAAGGLGLLGLLGLSRIFYRAKTSSSPTVSDERDRLIESKAGLVAYSVFWVFFVGASMGAWALFKDRGTVPVNLLPLFPTVGVMIVIFTQSVVALFEYRQGK